MNQFKNVNYRFFFSEKGGINRVYELLNNGMVKDWRGGQRFTLKYVHLHYKIYTEGGDMVPLLFTYQLYYDSWYTLSVGV